ncbi:MAG TPA: HEAT repeat domain-containing protein [Longimicrobium sp.]|nr:HEAT repeat domain-containing protein [Longimicrobium sp.]
MSQPAPGSIFLRTLAAAALREGDPAELAARAAGALVGVFKQQKSLVLDVQFTGFLFKGKPLGGVDSSLLRAAGQLIVMRITRVGFTAEAAAEDLEIFFAGLARPPAELGPDGIVGLLRRRKPYGVYVTTSAGETYRPEHRPRPEPVAAPQAAETGAPAPTEASPVVEAAPAAQPADAAPEAVRPATAAEEQASAPSSLEAQGGGEAEQKPVYAVGGFMLFDEADATDLSDFELLDDFPALDAPAAPAKAAPAAGPGGAGGGADAVASNDMFHFFRTAQGDHEDEEADALPGLLRAADNPARFDDLAQACTRAALRMVRAGHHARAVELLDALASEAESADRGRVFRDLAVQGLRRAATPETLHHLGELLQHGGAQRDRILHLFVFIGGEAVQLLETVLFRTTDPELRIAIFRRLIRMEGMSGRLAARAMTDPSPARTRMILELAVLPDVDPDIALRWLGEAAAHPDATVRLDVARLVAVVGGRGGLRILLDLLNNDRDPLVKRATIQALGTLGDAAAVPFLSRVVNDGDEEAQLAAVGALARIGSGEALPALLGVVNRRTLLGLKKASRVKTAAIAAIARIPTPAARQAITSLAAGKDADVAAEAQRALATRD